MTTETRQAYIAGIAAVLTAIIGLSSVTADTLGVLAGLVSAAVGLLGIRVLLLAEQMRRSAGRGSHS